MSSSDAVYLTQEGLDKLKTELQSLKDRRPDVAKRIKTARDMGDLSENAEYTAAREEQAFIEGKIFELENIIKNAQVSKISDDGSITVGAKVVVHVDGEEEEFHIVGAPEADPLKGKISHASPIGAALLGKKAGDSVTVEAPIGTVTYTVVKVG